MIRDHTNYLHWLSYVIIYIENYEYHYRINFDLVNWTINIIKSPELIILYQLDLNHVLC